MYLKIKKAILTPDKYGQKVAISMIWLYNDDDKWVRRVKLDDDIIQTLLSAKIVLNAITNWDTSEEAQHSTQQALL